MNAIAYAFAVEVATNNYLWSREQRLIDRVLNGASGRFGFGSRADDAATRAILDTLQDSEDDVVEWGFAAEEWL